MGFPTSYRRSVYVISKSRKGGSKTIFFVFTARLYASAVLAVIVSVCPSVCPSVRLSVTSRSCTKMAKPRIRLTTPTIAQRL